MKHYVILLATEDSAVEAAVKAADDGSDCEINRVETSCEVASLVMDGRLDCDFGVVDLDLRPGGRALLRTIGGAIPVVGIASKTNAGLSSLLQHRHIDAALIKPISSEKLWSAFRRMQGHPRRKPFRRAASRSTKSIVFAPFSRPPAHRKVAE